MLIGIIIGSVGTFALLCWLGRGSGKSGANSRVPTVENVRAVLVRSPKPGEE